ncbi:LptF/LptG family permease [Rickettsiella massiliensis]|uniref:LptF/LptG family permease n=1 Tax=Rickettsiella massiliensis TaxID=676517 RepID=UPI00029B5436|nr:LptF/LptG family permease [Rickettsiella massiliensis]
MTKQGTLWIRDGQDFIYIHSILTPTHLKNVTRYTFNSQQHLERVAFAEEVKYENQQWKATHIAYSTFNLPNIQSAQLKKAIWPLSFNPKLLKISVINPENMSLTPVTRNDYLP